MYKVFKSYYLYHTNRDEPDFIQIVDCDLNSTKDLIFEGSCRIGSYKEICIYYNNINNKSFNIPNTIYVEPLSYQELMDLINLLISDKCRVSIMSSFLLNDWINKLYLALLFYDDFIDYTFSE